MGKRRSPRTRPRTRLRRPGHEGERAAAVVHAAGVAAMGLWGGALLLWPERVRAGLGARALPWYQREVALLDLGHLCAAVLAARRPAGRAHLRAMSVTALLLAAGHAVEAARHRQGRGFHGLACALDAGWAAAALHCARGAERDSR